MPARVTQRIAYTLPAGTPSAAVIGATEVRRLDQVTVFSTPLGIDWRIGNVNKAKARFGAAQ